MMRSVNKYGFNVLIPATDATDVATDRSEVAEVARSVSGDHASDDVSNDDTPGTAAADTDCKFAEGHMLGEHFRGDGDGIVGDEDVRREVPIGKEKEIVNGSSNEAGSGQSGKYDSWKDMTVQESGERDEQSNLDPDVDMEEDHFASHGTAVQVSDPGDIDHQDTRHSSQGPVQGEETIAATPTDPTTAKDSIKTPALNSLYWRAADRVTATGVHFFNMPVEDLREMARLQAFEQAQKRRPQSSEELRALFVSAATNNRSAPEEHALAEARTKLQAGRIAMYGVQLRERMATMRMVAARATQQPRVMIDQLAVIAGKAREELDMAQKALNGDMRDVVIAKQALKSVTGVPVSEPLDATAEADALRRDKMINEIKATIAEYEAQAKGSKEHDLRA
jgi:hypothetical protein